MDAGELGRVPDAELVRRMQADDLGAFEALFERYRSPVYRTAYGLTGDPQAAEESCRTRSPERGSDARPSTPTSRRRHGSIGSP